MAHAISAPSRMKDGDYLMGDKSYRLHLQPNVPVGLFWSVTANSPVDGHMIDAGSHRSNR
ncbi:DUF1214 domain-containing protein [Rhizobium leguminosarum]|uniref:DUF1214 domain-containing protein n=1 Tax=Rhizobium leguminosarum TaxID=384 RepID=A0A6P0B938_RHILE|nr:DUF1214 domain-containing protein [Rhizobium leguminosarum]NEI36379.1 DUF1214 domain-containing protein [Rhizobium leguminosarum]NEI42646.1 DUF1214 domain-containing protein [Rhizobium leguminosarum]